MSWKAIILAGGAGTRLHPLTLTVNKHLLPVYDKPMIYYPLSTMMLAGLSEFIIISTPEAVPQFQTLLGDGSRWGMSFEYRVQEKPAGIAECFLIASDLIEGHNTALILGDNIFYGSDLQSKMSKAVKQTEGATIFGYEVADPSAFGVVVLDEKGNPVAIEEKPKEPKSTLAVPGLYFYDKQVVDIARKLKPSPRGELEITDVNLAYMERGMLSVQRFGRGTAWLDGGSHEALYEAGQFIKVVEERTGLKISCPEEIALRQGFVSREQFKQLYNSPPKTAYEAYLENLHRTCRL